MLEELARWTHEPIREAQNLGFLSLSSTVAPSETMGVAMVGAVGF